MAQAAPFIQAADDPQLREAMPLETISEAISAPGLQLPQIVGLALEGYGDRPALGYRAR
jgi:fatty acid CoA ligase FadD9